MSNPITRSDADLMSGQHIGSRNRFLFGNNMKIKTKKCTKCGVIYPATTEFFSINDKKRGYLRPDCKKCRTKTTQHYYWNNKEKERVRNRKYRRKNKELIKFRKQKYYQENKEIIKIKILT